MSAKKEEPKDLLDGIPEWFVGPLIADLVAHEVGHTLGLRHNFKASSIYSLEQINSRRTEGQEALRRLGHGLPARSTSTGRTRRSRATTP
jgi:hypothetical protein